MSDDGFLEGWHGPLALLALRTAPPAFRGVALRLHDKQIRCCSPRPGGAARKFTETVRLPCGTSLTLEKQAMRDGGRIRVVLARTGVTLVGHNLRLLAQRLPETVALAAEDRRLGDLVTLGGMLADLHDQPIRGIFDDQGHQVITLGTPTVQIRRSDICAAHVGES